MKRWEDFSEEDILQANVEKYDQEAIVEFYQNFEEAKYSYIEYGVIFKAVLEVLYNVVKPPVKAVDMCGGSGKGAFALKECDPGCEVTLVDVAEKMLDIARQKAEVCGIKNLAIVQDDAFSFLKQAAEYDIIIFSSAIHHFKDPVNLLQTAAQRLSPNGFIITIADPTTIIKTWRYRFFQFIAANSKYKMGAIKHCLSELTKNQNETASGQDFDVAEYQTHTGIDDVGMSHRLEQVGLQCLLHLRYPAGEPYMTKMMPYIGLCWAFSMVLHKNEASTKYQTANTKLQQSIKAGLPFKVEFLK